MRIGGHAPREKIEVDAAGKRFAIVASRFNENIVERLADGAVSCLREHGVADDAIAVWWVPGAWEIPALALRLARSGRFDAIVAVGCVIRGETPHFDYVAGHAAHGLARVAMTTDVAIGFGVITTENVEQAEARAGGSAGNKGWEAALAALEMAAIYERLGGGVERA